MNHPARETPVRTGADQVQRDHVHPRQALIRLLPRHQGHVQAEGLGRHGVLGLPAKGRSPGGQEGLVPAELLHVQLPVVNFQGGDLGGEDGFGEHGEDVIMECSKVLGLQLRNMGLVDQSSTDPFGGRTIQVQIGEQHLGGQLVFRHHILNPLFHLLVVVGFLQSPGQHENSIGTDTLHLLHVLAECPSLHQPAVELLHIRALHHRPDVIGLLLTSLLQASQLILPQQFVQVRLDLPGLVVLGHGDEYRLHSLVVQPQGLPQAVLHVGHGLDIHLDGDGFP
mmetsp:Transcript_41419/g.108906  ORF Transcript_41419/g.108906 Transcript_41419/m.108906 type:complete len:281 (-) Transcript_41419:593-1435(-)